LGGQTLADGIAVKKPGELTKPIIEEMVEDIFIVDESAVETGVLMLVELQKVLAEGAGAVSVAALLNEDTRARFAGRKVGLVITGGNIDVRLLSWVLTRGLVRDGRIVRLRIDIIDRPGVLAQVAKLIGDSGGNIIEVYHHRLFYDVPAKEAEVDAVVETRNEEHVHEIVANLRSGGFATRVLSARAADPTTI
jgi:threonine dehydratase